MEFTHKVHEWCKVLFSVSNSKFLFYENDNLLDYQDQQVKNRGNNGVAGYVMEQQRSMIFSEIKRNHFFDPNIDISSLLPILYYPIVFKKYKYYKFKTIYCSYHRGEGGKNLFGSIFQVGLKQKPQVKKNKAMIWDLESSNIGSESLQKAHITAEILATIIQIAFNNNIHLKN